MNLEERLNQYFSRESTVEILTQYELYYQISLGNFIYETIQDIENTNKKIKELNLKPTANEILANVFELIVHGKDDLESKFEYYIRKRAIIHALKDFINSDKELIQVDDYVEEKMELIQNDSYFTEVMYLQFESNFSTMHEYFDLVITDELSYELKNSFGSRLEKPNE